jgi:hypothetical protein
LYRGVEKLGGTIKFLSGYPFFGVEILTRLVPDTRKNNILLLRND